MQCNNLEKEGRFSMTNRWTEQDHFFMQEALKEAEKAYKKNEVPIGAVIIDDKEQIIGVGHNQVEEKKSQLFHAECTALGQATQKIDNWRLEECTLYVTLEPCTMCFAALKLSRIKTIIFGAESPIFGYQKDLDNFIKAESTQNLIIKGGLKKQECQKLLRHFFQSFR